MILDPPPRPRRRPGRACVAAACVLLGAPACTPAGDAEDGPAPNLLLISVDTQRADYLGCYGHPRDVSPTVDAIAAAGTVFEDVTAASPWTLPSHATMLSGKYPSRHGVIDHEYTLEDETIATLLQAAGYETMAVVNTTNVGDERFGLMRGFDRKKYEFEVAVVMQPDGTPKPGKAILNTGSAVAARAVRWLEARDPTRPFFLFLHFYDVHTDFTPDQQWREEFVSPYEGPLDGTTMQLVRSRFRGVPVIGEADTRHLKELYEAEIRTFDDVLAGFFERFDALGLAHSTVVALTSDHGEEFMEHGGVLHGRTYYQELMGIPLILRGPGVPAGARISRAAHLIDVAPTLLGLLGVPHGPMDGVDLSLAWRDPAQLPELRYLFAEADHNNIVEGRDKSNIRRMVRLGNHKLLYDTVTGKKELYDIAADPNERDELSATEPELLELLWGELQRYMAGESVGTYRGELDDETVELLETLGYTGDDSD